MKGELELAPVALEELDGSDELEQTGFWGRYKAEFGMRPFAFRIGPRGGMLVLHRRVAPGVALGYVPYGPDVPAPAGDPGCRERLLVSLADAARAHLPADVAFLRFDLGWRVDSRGGLLRQAKLRGAGLEIQPVHTVILDLQRTDRQLLEGMHHKTRYNIGLAARRGVEVYEGEAGEDLARWYAIKVENDRRDGIVTHSLRYFEALFVASGSTGGPGGPRLKLYLARVEGNVVGGIIVSVSGRAARYLHGASGDSCRNTMFTYALHWKGITSARELGAVSYDLYGMPPDDDPSHPMHGLYRFKTGFGGEIVHRLGCYDVPVKRPLYGVLRLPERARYVYYKRIRRFLRGALGRRRESASTP